MLAAIKQTGPSFGFPCWCILMSFSVSRQTKAAPKPIQVWIYWLFSPTWSPDSRMKTASALERYSADKTQISIWLLWIARTTSFVYAERKWEQSVSNCIRARKRAGMIDLLTSPRKHVPLQEAEAMPPLFLQHLGQQRLQWSVGSTTVLKVEQVRTRATCWRKTVTIHAAPRGGEMQVLCLPSCSASGAHWDDVWGHTNDRNTSNSFSADQQQ